MEKETFEALKKAGQSLNNLVEAWGNLVEAYKNPLVDKILNTNYPFNESFDELYSYSGKVATEEELRIQNSYFVLDLLNEKRGDKK